MEILASTAASPRGEDGAGQISAQQTAARQLARRLVAQANRDPLAAGDGGGPLNVETVNLPNTRLELDVDEASGRVIGRFVDQETGAVVRQVPSEEMVRLLARARQMIGALLDEHA